MARQNDYDNIDISEYVKEGDDDIADYKMRDDSYGSDDDDKNTIPFKLETILYATLIDKLGLLKLYEIEQKIADKIVCIIDVDG